MIDHVSEEVRSYIMSSVKSENTSPELGVRRLVHRMGYRYVLHRKDLPGKPDLVFPGRSKVIFVHGCFWHGHSCRYGRLPNTRPEYWKPKIGANQRRDARQQRKLRRQGWSVMVIWQCQLKNVEPLTKRVRRFLNCA